VYDDDINRALDEEVTQGQGGGVGGDGGDGGDVGGSGTGNLGGSDVPDSSRAIPLDEEMYTPAMTKSRTKEGSSGFDAIHFYQYVDGYFSRTNLRLDAIGERQQ